MFAEAVFLLRRMGRSLGWMGALAIAVVLLALGVAKLLNHPLQQQVLGLEQDLKKSQSEARAHAASAAGATGLSEMERFYRFFPLQPALSDLLREIYAEAGHHGLTLERGEYQYAAEPGLGLARYRVSLPVRGNYRQVKAFVVKVLDEQPNLILEDVRFTREQVGAPGVEAKLQFSLMVDAR